MKIFLVFVSLLVVCANAYIRQNPKFQFMEDPVSVDFNEIEILLQKDRKLTSDAIQMSLQQVEPIVRALEDNDMEEAGDVKKLLGFLADTKVPEIVLVRRKREAVTNNCTEFKNQYNKANSLSEQARSVMSSVASSTSSASDTMSSFLSLSATPDIFMKKIYLNLTSTMNSLISINTKTLNDLQNALFELTYAGATFQDEIMSNNCTHAIIERIKVFQTNAPKPKPCPDCILGEVQCPMILSSPGPSDGVCSTGKTLITCKGEGSNDGTKCCCK